MNEPAQTGNANMISSDELTDLAHRVLAEQTTRRDHLKGEARDRIWSSAAELGWLMLTLPEARGGLGQTFAVAGALYTELGRTLSSMPFLGSMLAVEALVRSDTEVSEVLLTEITAGTAIVATSLPDTKPVTARRDGSGFVFEGRLENVLCPPGATHLLTHAVVDGAAAVFVATIADLPRRSAARRTWDETRFLADVDVAGMPSEGTSLLAHEADAEALIARLSAHFDLAIACDSIGGAEQILSDTVDYSKTRQQFGRFIGSFQAIKHRCADMKTWLESARAITLSAVNVFAETGEAGPLAAAAKLHAADIYRRIAMDAVQLHGGIGFTWEQDCHLFLKRALLNDQLGGSPEDYCDRLFDPFAELVGGRLA